MVRLKRSSATFALFCTDSATSPAASLTCPYKSSTSPTTWLALPCNCIFLSPVTLPTDSCILPPKFLAVPPILFSSMLRSCEVRPYAFVIEHRISHPNLLTLFSGIISGVSAFPFISGVSAFPFLTIPLLCDPCRDKANANKRYEFFPAHGITYLDCRFEICGLNHYQHTI